MRLDGQLVKLVEVPPQLGWVVALAPDDRTAYALAREDDSADGAYNGIVAVDLTSGRQTPIFNAPAGRRINSAVLSDDGRRFAFFTYTDRDGRTTATLATMQADGGGYRQIHQTMKRVEDAPQQIQWSKDGRALFLRNCSSCHGLNSEGSSDAPSLIGVGAAAVDFQVSTGRMPAAADGAQVEAKRPEFTHAEVAALAAYIASLGPGPAIPDKDQLDYTNVDAAQGGAIYRTNCSMCHNFAGSGGALTHGKYAASLRGVSAKDMYEAMLTGPQSMKWFGLIQLR